jgi:pyridoxamine 5'-phosphate oxidase
MGLGERIDYSGDGLSEEQLAPTPWRQVDRWVRQAIARARTHGDVPEPLAMAVATVDAQGAANVRTVLMRFFDERGPGFVTSLDSIKCVELAANPSIAAALTWSAMFRAIRFRGLAVPVDRLEVEAYFESRPWGSRISAWASRQSHPIASRAELEVAYQEYAARWPDHGRPDDVPVPDRWGGFRIACHEVEFWAGRSNRLHDRLVFSRIGEGGLDEVASWAVSRRQP